MSNPEKFVDRLFIDLCTKLKDFDKPLNENFIKLTSNFDRFKFMWCIGFIHQDVDRLLDTTNYQPKDFVKSKEFRREGNELYKEKKFSDAILKYNSSIRYAPCKVPDGETENQLPLAYANRSAVFFQMDEFKLSLNDIEQAIRFGYPNDLKHKLIERKFNCLLRLEAYNELNEFVKQEKITITPSLLEQIRMNLGDWDEFRLNDEEKLFQNYANINFELSNRNTRCSNASKSITIDYKLLSGFSLKAVEDIKIGDLLVDESPYASVLLSENIDTHCLECMVPLNHLKMNLAYCRQCSLVSYCSSKCEKKGWHNHHKFECSRFNMLAFQSGLTHMEWLSLRIILKASHKYLMSLKQTLYDYEIKYENSVRDETSLTEMLHAEAEYKSDSYLAIFNLITNSAVRKLNDLFRRSFVAFFLVKFLIKIEFFGKEPPKKLVEQICFIGGLLLRHLQSISCNAHEISVLKIEKEGLKAMATSYANGIGAGIYAILSLFNHSCDPHVVRYFRGSKCQVRAIRSIKKDEEIYDNYGVVYAVNGVEERREKLIDQYFFHCICEPCEKDWPRYAKIPNDLNLSNFKCAECLTNPNVLKVGECPKCEIELDNLRLEQLAANQSLKVLLSFNGATNLDDQKIKNKIHDMFEAFCNYLLKLDSYKIKRPFQDYNSYEEAMKQCLNFIHFR